MSFLETLLTILATQTSANYYVCNPPSYGDGSKSDEALRLEVNGNTILIDGSKYVRLNGFEDKPEVHVYNQEIWSDFDIRVAIVDTSNNGENNGKWPSVKKFTLRSLYHVGPEPQHGYLAYAQCKSF